MKHKTATVAMSTFNKVGNVEHAQAQRGGSVAPPSRVELVVQSGEVVVKVIVRILEDGTIDAPSWTRKQSPGKTQKMPVQE